MKGSFVSRTDSGALSNQPERTDWALALSRFGLPILGVALVITFSKLNPSFFSVSSFINIAQQNAALAVVSVGMTFAVISGNMDLSPGSMIALAGMIIGLVYSSTGSLTLGFALGVLVAVSVGILNGCLVALLKLNPVIVTLAAMIWARGLALALTEGASIAVRTPFVESFNRGLWGVPLSVYMVIPVYVLGWVLLSKTRMGRYTYSLGGDEVATRLAGINVTICKIAIFVFGGLMVGLAAIMSVCRFATAQPIFATGLELDAIIAVVIGGNSLNGGEGGLGKTIRGVLFIAVLSNGLSSLGLTDNYYYFTKGVIILVALVLEVGIRSWRRRALTEKGVAYGQ